MYRARAHEREAKVTKAEVLGEPGHITGFPGTPEIPKWTDAEEVFSHDAGLSLLSR